MEYCKTCGWELTNAAAGASIFALSFLPVGGRRFNRQKTTRIAKQVGPLCAACLETRRDLKLDPEKRRQGDGANVSSTVGSTTALRLIKPDGTSVQATVIPLDAS
jgi:hypothetical protein